MTASWARVPPGEDELTDARAAASVLSAELHLDQACAPYAPHTWQEEHRGQPTLHLDDVSAIPFLVDIAGVEEYQHRARVRAGDGDLYAVSTTTAPGYERYCQSALAMGNPEQIMAEPDVNKLAVAEACSRGPAFARLCEVAAARGGMTLHPYMGIEAVWELAERLTQAARVPVRVLAPPPPITWLANDKRFFGRLVELVLGESWLVETHVTTDPDAMSRALSLLARRHQRVGLKRTRCASAMGNVVFVSRELEAIDHHAVRAQVDAFLKRTGWVEGEEVLAVAWENTDLSPSTQLWIPRPEVGPPRLDGIYEQILDGPSKVFVGSRPSTLPAPVHDALARSALLAAAGLQALGYVGRCSFDHLVVGDPEGDFRVVFVECNGRWGGTSTPMALVERLVPGPRPPYRAQDFVDERLVGVPFEELASRVGDQLYRPGSQPGDGGSGRFIFYNVGPLAASGKLDVIALGRTQVEAEEALLVDLPALLFQ